MMKVFYLNVVAVDNIVIREEKNAKQDIKCVCLSDIFRQARGSIFMNTKYSR